MTSFIISAIIVTVYYIAVLDETYAGNVLQQCFNPRGDPNSDGGETSRRNPRYKSHQDKIDECLGDMENIFGLRTPPVDCLKIALRDVLFHDHRLGVDIRHYVSELVNRVNGGPIKPDNFCFKRAIDACLHPNMAELYIAEEIAPDSIEENLLRYISQNEMNEIRNNAMQCIDQLQCFKKGEKNILKNAIKFHKLGIRPEEYANNPNYFFHQPGSHGEVYLNFIADNVNIYEAYIEDPFTFCYYTNGELVPEENQE